MKNVLLAGIALMVCAMPASCAEKEKARRPRTDRYDDPLPEGAIARLGTLRLRGFQGPVIFSPDGKYLVAASRNDGEQAVFWDIATGRRVKALRTNNYISRLTYSPDGRQLAAAAGFGGLSTLWDAATDKQRFTFIGQSVAFSADGKKLISTCGGVEKTTVRAYDIADGKLQSEWSLAHSRPDAFTLSVDGRFAVAPRAGDKSSISIFDVQKKIEVKTFPVKVGRIRGGGFSRDGRRLVASGEDGWMVWDWASGKSLRTYTGRVRNAPAFSPDGRRLAWISDNEGPDRVISLWVVDVDGGRPRRLGVTRKIGWSNAAAFSDDGKKLAVVTEGSAIVLVDSHTGRDLLPLDAHTGAIESIAYFSDARYLVTRDAFRLLVWEAATGRLLRRLPDDLPKGETVLLNTANRGRVVTAEMPDGILRLRDLVTGKELRRLKGKDGFVSAAPWDISVVSSGGTAAAILGPGGVRVYDLDSGDIRCHFTPEHAIWDMNFSADKRTLVITIQDYEKGLLTIYHDTRTGGKAEPPAAPKPQKHPNGCWRAQGAEAKAQLRKRKLLDATGQPAFTGADGGIGNVYESPDGRYLAVEWRTGHPNVLGDPNNKNFLTLWDTATRRVVMEVVRKQFDKHGSHQIVGFSTDARMLISTTHWPGTIHLWETATGRERLRLQGHMAGDVRLCFRPDGRALVSGGADTQVFLWDVTGRAPDGVWRGTQHSPERLRQLWEEVAGDDAARAYRAMWSLVAAPAQATALIQEHLHPVAPVEPRQLSRLLADLNSDSFAARTKATQELQRLGELAELALRKALEGQPTLEVRRRCGELLDKLSVLSGDRLRAVRAVEVLEHLGTAEARELLEKLAQGDPAARLTREARTAAKRSLQGEAGQPR
jgi:WD40 repeat protein